MGVVLRLFLLFLSLISIQAFAKTPTVEELVDKADRLYRSKTAHLMLDMKLETPNWNRTLEIEMWSQGMEKTFILIHKPRKDKGIATLRVSKKMWNYFPKINKVIKVPPSMMMGSWMGSDLTNDDLVKESSYLKDYEAKILVDDTSSSVWMIEMKPKPEALSVWGKIVSEIDKQNLLLKKQTFFNERGELARTMNFKDVKQMGGKLIPSIIEIIPANKKGNKTTLIWKSGEFDVNLDANVFTRKNLQEKRN